MARSRLKHVVRGSLGSDDFLRLVEGATVNLFQPGTSDALIGTLYDARTGGNVVTNPFTSDETGEVVVWTDTPQSVEWEISGTGHFPNDDSGTFAITTYRVPDEAHVAPEDDVAGGGATDLDDLTDVNDAIAPAAGDYLRHDGTDWKDSPIQEADIPGEIARDTEITAAVGGHEGEADPHGVYVLESAHTKAAHDSLGLSHDTLADVSANDHHNQAHGPADHTGTSDEHAFVMGVAGTLAGSAADAADFLLVVPFNGTLKRIKTTKKAHGGVATAVQIRRSTDSGATFADFFGSATFGAASVVATADPTDIDVNEGDVLNFSYSTGGGSNLLVEVIAKAR